MKPLNMDSLQTKIEQPFQAKPEAHFVLNDIAQRLLEPEDLLGGEVTLLRDLFIEIQEQQDQEGIIKMIGFRDAGHITTTEMYFVSNYFMLSKQIGPESDEFMREFLDRNLSPEDMGVLLERVSLPEHTRSLIHRCYKKLKGVV